LPIEIDGNRLGTRLDLPHIGQHTRELLAQLGYAPQQIESLVNAGASRAPRDADKTRTHSCKNF
jgi:crotonobetainyl-CoA:carnitine CoA-transferase CaiB-like acyl-CoA transferase